MKLDYRKIIYSKLKKAGKKPLTFKELLRSCRGKGFEFEKFTKTVDKFTVFVLKLCEFNRTEGRT